MVDADLADLYGVPMRRLNEQIKRNAERFPADFMFRLTTDEKAEVVANCDHLAKLKFSKALAVWVGQIQTIAMGFIVNVGYHCGPPNTGL
jgi:hypothetical protein